MQHTNNIETTLIMINLWVLLPLQAVISKLTPCSGVPVSLHDRLCCLPHAVLIMWYNYVKTIPRALGVSYIMLHSFTHQIQISFGNPGIVSSIFFLSLL